MKTSMKITILCRTDYAASGHKMCEAIRQHTIHDVEIYTGWNKRYMFKNGFGHSNQVNVVTPLSKRKIQRRINNSDVVHIKGDWPVRDRYLGLKVMHVPTVQTVSGMSFRKIEHGGRGNFHPAEYKATVKTAFEPDLLYPEYGDIWIPHPVDSVGKEVTWTHPDIPVLMHSPSNRAVKNTRFILEVFEKIKKKRKVEIVILEGLPIEHVIEEKKRATIFLDQFRVGFYGNSAIEAMQWGVPTCAWVSEMAVKQSHGTLKGCPIVTATNDKFNVAEWANIILWVLNQDMSDLSRRTKEWCDNVHSYQAVAKKCDEIYEYLRPWDME